MGGIDRVGGRWRDLRSTSPTFVRLWSATLVSSLGDWAGITAALALVARQGDTPDSSAAAISLVMLFRLVAALVAGPFAGVLADRIDRRRSMIAADVGRMVLYATLPILPGVLWIAIVSAGIEVLSTIWGPARDSVLPEIVPSRDLASANGANVAAAYGTLPFGAALFTVTVAVAAESPWLSQRPEALALWFDAFTFGASALIVARSTLPSARSGSTSGQGWVGSLREGVAFVRTDAAVRALLATSLLVFLAVGALTAMAPLLATYDLGGDDVGFGAIVTMTGIGLLLGLVSVPSAMRRVGERGFSVAVLVMAAALAVLASVSTLQLALLASFVLGASAGVSWAFGLTAMQRGTPDRLRGRTIALLTTSARACLLGGRVAFPALAVAITVFRPGVSGVRVSLAIASMLVALGGWLSWRAIGSQTRADAGPRLGSGPA